MRMKDISKLDCFWNSSFRDLSSILQNSSLWNSSSVWKILELEFQRLEFHFFFFF